MQYVSIYKIYRTILILFKICNVNTIEKYETNLYDFSSLFMTYNQ